jgi:hypothetical protein
LGLTGCGLSGTGGPLEPARGEVDGAAAPDMPGATMMTLDETPAAGAEAGVGAPVNQFDPSADAGTRLAALEAALTRLIEDFELRLPAIDRMLGIEADIRLLMTQLSKLAEPPAAAPPMEAPPVAATAPAPLVEEPAGFAARAAPPTGRAQSGIHRASYRALASLKTGWGVLRSDYGDLLSGLAYRVVEVVVPGRGTFLSLIAGPFPDLESAARACRVIEAQGKFCEVADFSDR